MLKTWTHRQYLTGIAWLEEQWNNPSLTDYYIMQVAAEACFSFRKRPSKVDLEKWKLQFKGSVSKNDTSQSSERRSFYERLTPEQRNDVSKAFWLAHIPQQARLASTTANESQLGYRKRARGEESGESTTAESGAGYPPPPRPVPPHSPNMHDHR